MIRKTKDNEQVQVKATSNNIQTFPFNKRHVTTHPIETMLRDVNIFKHIPNMDVYEIECDPYCDMYAEILRILKSEYYDSIPEHYIESTEQYFRIIYESKEYEDMYIHTPGYYAGMDNADREWTPIDVTTTLLSSTNTPEEKQTMKQISEDLKILSEDMNDDRYRIFVKKSDIIQNENYSLFMTTENGHKAFNYKCLDELITDDSEISIDVSIGSLSNMLCICKPCDMVIAASIIRADIIAKHNPGSHDIIQNSICLNLNDYNKFNHIWITICE